jgi:hypothetical protein
MVTGATLLFLPIWVAVIIHSSSKIEIGEMGGEKSMSVKEKSLLPKRLAMNFA